MIFVNPVHTHLKKTPPKVFDLQKIWLKLNMLGKKFDKGIRN